MWRNDLESNCYGIYSATGGGRRTAIAEDREDRLYDELLTECQEQVWNIKYCHMAVGAREYVEKKLIISLKHCFCCSNTNIRKSKAVVQEGTEKASYWI